MSTPEPESRPPLFPWLLTVLAVAAAGLLAACSDADTPATEISVRDSAGVTIVELGPLPGDLPAVGIDGPTTDIGGASMDEQAQLHQVQGAVRLSTGEIVVANGGSNELRFFDAEGNHVRTVAGSGDGPGEFQRLWGLVRVPGDSLIAYGVFGARTSLFAPDGEHVRQLRVDLEDPTSVTPRGRTSDGRRIVSVLTSDLSSSSLETGVYWPESLWLLVDSAGSVHDTIGSYPWEDGALYQYHGEGFGIQLDVPFAAGTSYDIVGDRLYLATGDRAEVRIHGPDGELERIFRWDQPPEPVTEDLRRSWEEGPLDNIDDPQMRRRFREALDELTYPERVPVVTDVEATPDGEVWVRGHAPPDAEVEPAWWGFGADGGFLGRMELPITVYDLRNGVAVGRSTDELDVQHVQLFRYEVGG